MDKNLCIIPVRGGSKGIPNKNIIDISGKPMIYYSICASQSANVDFTYVSTDSKQIAMISEKYGAKIIKRPQDISTDTSSSEEALSHFCKNVNFDIMIFIQPTSPLLLAEDLIKGINIIKSGQATSVFSVYKEHWIPRWNLDIKPINWNPQSRPRRQDMPEQYVENGAFYITTREQFLDSGIRYGEKNLDIVEMPLSRSIQVDTLSDLELVNKLLKKNDQ